MHTFEEFIYCPNTGVSAAVSSERLAASHGDELHVASCVRVREAIDDAGPGIWRAANRMKKVRLVIRGFCISAERLVVSFFSVHFRFVPAAGRRSYWRASKSAGDCRVLPMI